MRKQFVCGLAGSQKYVAAVLAGALFIPSATILATPVDLGTAGSGDWAALEIGNGSVTVDSFDVGGTSAVWGNVGVAQNENLTMSGGSLIYGNLSLSSSATTTFSGGSGVAAGFSTFLGQDTVLNAARTDALAAASAAAALGGTPTTVVGGMVLAPGVYSLTSLSLGGSDKVTLSGAGQYIFNISGALNLQGTSQIVLANGATAGNVLYNITGTTTAQTGGGAILNGVILAPDASVVVDSGVGTAPHAGVDGEVISGQDITIQSGSGIQDVTIPPPSVVPDTGSTLGLLGFVAGLLVFARRKFAEAAPTA
jgi:hypothetical protein